MASELLHRIRTAASMLRPTAFAVRAFRCPLCAGWVLIRLSRDPIGVRCLGCGASAITLSLARALQRARPGFRSEAVYELSSRGPLYEFLRREVGNLTVSEYFDDVPPGEKRHGVLCQDVQQLTFADRSFDLCTSTEVFEHVPDDRRGFGEIRRVLRPGGAFVFTVPLSRSVATVERAVLRDGRVAHLLPPEYHGDRLRGQGRVLVYRDYGTDIEQRLLEQGFASARIERQFETTFLGQGSAVIVATA